MPDHIPSAHSCFFLPAFPSFFFSVSYYFSASPTPSYPIPSRLIQLILSPTTYESAKINLSCFGIKPVAPFVRGGKGRFFFSFFLNARRLHRRSPRLPLLLPFCLASALEEAVVSSLFSTCRPCRASPVRACSCASRVVAVVVVVESSRGEPLVIPRGCGSPRTRVPVCLQLLGLVASRRQGEADE